MTACGGFGGGWKRTANELFAAKRPLNRRLYDGQEWGLLFPFALPSQIDMVFLQTVVHH